ncbi:MAG: U32 family peptidase [Bacteroidota bacterium]
MVELELLAPAKDFETGIAAITHGADAVYIAAQKFGAREKAGNPINDIAVLCRFAHAYHTRVYVTVNTIIFDNEIAEVQALIHEIYNAGADAIIIQDFAIFNMNIPPIAIHASTQMHNIDPNHINFLEDIGVSRIVLPRELTLDEIANFRRKTKAELEFFIHGALCVSYSGQCYLSHALSGRSANRGACAQPCRLAYDLVDEMGNVLVENKHLLSLKDLNLSSHLTDLIRAGITSFKIEGRLKDVAYVKNITAHYSKLLNQFISLNSGYKRASSGECSYSFTPDPERTFNRGFSTHFINGRTTNQASVNTPKSIGKKVGVVDRIYRNYFYIDTIEPIHNGDGLCFFNPQNQLKGFLVNKVEGNKIFPNQMPTDLNNETTIYRNEDFEFEQTLKRKSAERKIDCNLEVTITPESITLAITDIDGISTSIEIPNQFDEAKNPNAAALIENQLRKTGDTIFRVDRVEIDVSSKIPFIPASVINSARRELITQLHNKRVETHQRPIRNVLTPSAKVPHTALSYKANVANKASSDFLQKHGAQLIEPAFEVKKPKGDIELMVTRYCIKHELGLCPSKQGAKPTGRLYLKNNQNIFPLLFDCKNCVMKVMQPNT